MSLTVANVTGLLLCCVCVGTSATATYCSQLTNETISLSLFNSSSTYTYLYHNQYLHNFVMCIKPTTKTLQLKFVANESKATFCYNTSESGNMDSWCARSGCIGANSSVTADSREGCVTPSGQIHLRVSFYCTLFLIILLWALPAVTAVIDLRLPKDKLTTLRRCFSLMRNWRKLTGLPKDPQESIACLYLLRFLATVWTVVGHSYVMIGPYLDNFEEMERDLESSTFLGQLVLSFRLGTDVFFLLGGCLVAHRFFYQRSTALTSRSPQKSSETIMYWMQFYWRRLIRLWPANVFIILVIVFVAKPLSPLPPPWPQYDPDVVCDGWALFKNIFFLNSLLPTFCLGWLWYLGNDFIFYLLSPLFLIAFKRAKGVGYLCIAVVCLSSQMTRLLLLSSDRRYYTRSTRLHCLSSEFLVTYVPPYTRIGPYLIGLTLGYRIAIGKSKKTTAITAGKQVFYTACGLALILFSVVGFHERIRLVFGDNYALGFLVLQRDLFALGVAFVIVRLEQWPLDSIWLTPPIVLMSNLGYTAYLMHMLWVTGSYLLTRTHPQHWSGHTRQFPFLFAQFAVSYIVALPGTLCVELPFMALGQWMMETKAGLTACWRAVELPKEQHGNIVDGNGERQKATEEHPLNSTIQTA